MRIILRIHCIFFYNKMVILTKFGQKIKVTLDISMQQELSYRKQIARQMRTQYVEGTYNPVTLKSNLSHSRSLETEPLDR